MIEEKAVLEVLVNDYKNIIIISENDNEEKYLSYCNDDIELKELFMYHTLDNFTMTIFKQMLVSRYNIWCKRLIPQDLFVI